MFIYYFSDNSKESHKSYVGSSKLVNGKILIEEQARSNGSEISNGNWNYLLFGSKIEMQLNRSLLHVLLGAE